MDALCGPGPGGCSQTRAPSWCSEPVGNVRAGQDTRSVEQPRGMASGASTRALGTFADLVPLPLLFCEDAKRQNNFREQFENKQSDVQDGSVVEPL